MTRIDRHEIVRDRGATLVEYTLLVALLAIATLGAVRFLSAGTAAALEEQAAGINSAATAGADGGSGGGAGGGADGGAGGGVTPPTPVPAVGGGAGGGVTPPTTVPAVGGGAGGSVVDGIQERPIPAAGVRWAATSNDGTDSSWNAVAVAAVRDAAGMPITTGRVEVRITRSLLDNGNSRTDSWSTSAHIVNGEVRYAVNGQQIGQWWSVEAVTFTVTGVFDLAVGVEWDGSRPEVKVTAPEPAVAPQRGTVGSATWASARAVKTQGHFWTASTALEVVDDRGNVVAGARPQVKLRWFEANANANGGTWREQVVSGLVSDASGRVHVDTARILGADFAGNGNRRVDRVEVVLEGVQMPDNLRWDQARRTVTIAGPHVNS